MMCFDCISRRPRGSSIILLDTSIGPCIFQIFLYFYFYTKVLEIRGPSSI